MVLASLDALWDHDAWVRQDGIPILAERADLATRTDFLTGVTQRADGTYASLEFWIGAPDRITAGANTTTCDSWTSTTAQGQEGFSGYANQDFTRPVTCTANSNGLICLEDRAAGLRGLTRPHLSRDPDKAARRSANPWGPGGV